ncbi:MAG: EndoU domain-containing protein, partial [Actinobacteria bacterium]|nr:EndoU domain-containing protein [Actinomycetota bacterium]
PDARVRPRHILGGDGRSNGGHRPGTGYPGKTEFPDGWTDDRILDTVDDAAQNPVSAMTERRTPTSAKHPQGRAQYSYVGEANGLQVRIVLDDQGRVASAHPLEGQPGTFTNPDLPPGLTPDKRPVYIRPDGKTGNPGHWTYKKPDGSPAYVGESGQPMRRPRDSPPVPVPPPGDDEDEGG